MSENLALNLLMTSLICYIDVIVTQDEKLQKTNVMPYLPSQLKIWGCVEKSFWSHQYVKSSWLRRERSAERLEGRKVPHIPKPSGTLRERERGG
jgi:hypothetical protein